jgi:hypothetical protein
MKTLAQQYLDMIDQYDIDLGDALSDILKLLEKVSPEVLRAEIENVEEYISDWSE